MENRAEKYYWWILAAITLLGAALRFWHLGELQQLIFDEVYFPKYAWDHLTGTYYFDTHPPLAKYLIAAGIWIHQHLPWVDAPPIGSVAIEKMNAVAWRWLNAFSGTLLIVLAARTTFALRASSTLSLLVAIFVATDGALVVESRFGLVNIYLAGFGLLGLYFLVQAFQRPRDAQRQLFFCGLGMGLSYSIKWNGLGFSLLPWVLVFSPSAALWLLDKFRFSAKIMAGRPFHALFRSVPLWQQMLTLFVIPLVLYCLLWIPYVNQYERFGFVEMQKQIFGYHHNTIKADAHPYCSRWYTWPLMKRPISYYFHKAEPQDSPGGKNYYDIHLFGNPVLYWLASASLPLLLCLLLRSLWRWWRDKIIPEGLLFQSVIIVGFAGNWLPWLLVSRCTFLYHYLPSSLFSFISLAWLLQRGLLSGKRWLQVLAGFALLVILLSFLYFLPFQLGIPLNQESFYQRMWFRSWI